MLPTLQPCGENMFKFFCPRGCEPNGKIYLWLCLLFLYPTFGHDCATAGLVSSQIPKWEKREKGNQLQPMGHGWMDGWMEEQLIDFEIEAFTISYLLLKGPNVSWLLQNHIKGQIWRKEKNKYFLPFSHSLVHWSEIRGETKLMMASSKASPPAGLSLLIALRH